MRNISCIKRIVAVFVLSLFLLPSVSFAAVSLTRNRADRNTYWRWVTSYDYRDGDAADIYIDTTKRKIFGREVNGYVYYGLSVDCRYKKPKNNVMGRYLIWYFCHDRISNKVGLAEVAQIYYDGQGKTIRLNTFQDTNVPAWELDYEIIHSGFWGWKVYEGVLDELSKHISYEDKGFVNGNY